MRRAEARRACTCKHANAALTKDMHVYAGVHWDPPEGGAPGEVLTDKRYVFKYPRPPRPRALRIYECHVGMSSMVRE